MSAAARARRLSEQAEIIVIERTRHVSFANCGLPYHIGGEIPEREALLLQTPETLAETLNLDVRIGHEATAITRSSNSVSIREIATGQLYTESYDRLILCPGAFPITPPLPGVDHPRIHTLRNIEDMDAINAAITPGTATAVVIGAGYIGVEMAENLRHRGLQVDLVEMLEQIMPPLDPEMARDLQYHLEYHGVRLHLGTAAASFADAAGRVSVVLTNGESMTTDLVIMAVGVRPDVRLAQAAGLELGPRGGIRVDQHMRTSDASIYAAGDAVEVIDTVSGEPTLVPLAGPGNRQGRVAADHIFGRDSRYESTQGTAIVKVFQMTGGGTGASEKTLRRGGIPYRKVYVHPSGHASYYPGTAPMQLKLLFAPITAERPGRLLGAQVVGYDGVDKRIDVLATALRAGLTVFDLEHLELAYAPPYGSAKDPVNMAGFVAANLLRGDIDFWYAEDYPQAIADGVLVDVRGAAEYKAWHIPEAINIPLGSLRTRLPELAPDKAIYLYCRVGFRSYLAHRVLVQSGFTAVRTLAGGSKTFCSFHRTPLCTGRPGVPFVPHAEEKLAARTDSACAA
jgi:NADPH-dependent 2,4-dienoyl-CoA reductase/sulfur reductase-like enzyme/rhodanese-related sulfurtransferase